MSGPESRVRVAPSRGWGDPDAASRTKRRAAPASAPTAVAEANTAAASPVSAVNWISPSVPAVNPEWTPQATTAVPAVALNLVATPVTSTTKPKASKEKT
ncbi:hypothetical protein AORI_1768 [Amycolatopsis keratiniphila]|uniref:Uncharacterized protein n=1 Tax=Amycolatopsis keratiniphila TaxID=129921 RepID=R4SW29_9PSEU|nr:hypothetical protein AORI_1768 [Amycolatopsis keratiniphila]